MSTGDEGLLLIDKPSGPTSHDIVATVRRALGGPRVGHAGTLDPMASGLLPLVVGRATRLVRYLPDDRKEYEGSFLLGLTTTTDDVGGRVLSRHAGEFPVAATVARTARDMEGTQVQVPPAVSARKVAGQRLYRINRRAPTVQAPPTEIRVEDFVTEPETEPQRYRFRVSVSAGAYVRALVRDLGSRLGCGGALAALRRTAIGPMSVSAALPIEAGAVPDPDSLRRGLISLERMPLTPPPLRLIEEGETARFRNGAALACSLEPGPRRVFSPSGRLLGIGEIESGRLHPRVVLPVPD